MRKKISEGKKGRKEKQQLNNEKVITWGERERETVILNVLFIRVCGVRGIKH